MNVGQHVVCIDDFFAPEIAALYTALPKEGEQYVIRAMHEGNNRDDGKPEMVLALLLVGLVNPCPERAGGKERGFNSKRFREVEERFDTNRGQGVSFDSLRDIDELVTTERVRVKLPCEMPGVNDGDVMT